MIALYLLTGAAALLAGLAAALSWRVWRAMDRREAPAEYAGPGPEELRIQAGIANLLAYQAGGTGEEG